MQEFDPTKDYPKVTESPHIIRFQDCDPLQHLNNAKYFDYYYNSRDDQVFRLYGVKMSELYQEFKSIWVVYNHQISYLKSAMMGEWVRILSRIIWFNHNTLVVEYFMTNEERTHLKNILWTTLKFVALGGKSIDHPEPISKFLECLTVKDVDYSPNNFQERIRIVKEEIEGKKS